MTQQTNGSRGPCRDAFEAMVVLEFQRKSILCDKATLESTGLLVCSVAVTAIDTLTSLSSRHLRAINAIQHKMPELTSEFVRAIATSAFRGNRITLQIENGEFRKSTRIADAKFALSEHTDLTCDFNSAHIEEWAGEVAGQTYLENKLGIPRSTLHLWQRNNAIIALRKGRRNHVFPIAQFVDGRPIPGIKEVLSILSNHRKAWFWLIQTSSHLNDRTPIEMLRHDFVDEVLVSARAYASVGL